MNAQKFTQKSLEALQSAQDLATEYQNMQIEQQHLLYALIAQEDGLIGQMLERRAGAAPFTLPPDEGRLPLGAGERARQHPRHLRHPGGHL